MDEAKTAAGPVMREQELRETIIACGRGLAASGLVVGTAGNISCRLDARRFLVTPGGMDYDKFGPGDLCVVDAETGEVTGARRPSIETGLHAGVYRRRPEVGAVVHTHSLFATVMAVARKELPCILDAMAIHFDQGVPVARYAVPGSKELADNVGWALGKGNGALLANHGALAVGADLAEARARAELIERAAQIFVQAGTIGRAVPIEPELVGSVQAFFKTRYGQVPGTGAVKGE